MIGRSGAAATALERRAAGPERREGGLEPRAAEDARHAAATRIQAAWRAFHSRRTLAAFEVEGRRVAADGAAIVALDRCPPISAAIRKGRAVDLGPVRRVVAELIADHLQGREIFAGPALAQKLREAGERLKIPSLVARADALLESHRDHRSRVRRAFHRLVGRAVLAANRALGRARLRRLVRHGFKRRFVATPVGRVHAVVAEGFGTLPPVVVLHGLASNAVAQRKLLRALRPHFRQVIGVDLPGHGESEVPAGGLDSAALRRGVDAALDQLLDRPAWVFGNSLGGLAALHFARAFPEKVAGLALASPAGTPLSASQRERMLDEFRITTRARAAERVRELEEKGLKATLMTAAVEVSLTAPKIQGLLESAGPAHEMRPRHLRGLSMPVLLIWGQRDRLFPRRHRDFYVENLRDKARILEPEALGHSPNSEAPEWVAEALAGYARDARVRTTRSA